MTLCSACYCGSAVINVASERPIESVEGFLYTGAVIYCKPREYFDEWLEFAKRQRQAIQRGESSFSYNLGLRVCLKILSEFGLVNPKTMVNPSLMDAWAKYWLTVIGQIAQMTKTKYSIKHPLSETSQ